MNIGDIITTKDGIDLKIIKVKNKILICRLLDWVDDSAGMYKSTDKRIVRKSNVVFIQKKLF